MWAEGGRAYLPHHLKAELRTPLIRTEGAASLGCGVAVASAADGFEEGGARGIGFDLLAEIEDVLVEGAGLGIVFEAPAFVEEFVAGDDFAAATGEKGEQL